MDNHYARRLRDWLRADPGTKSGSAADERDWLREIPAPPAPRPDAEVPVREHRPEDPAPQPEPAERWSVRGQLPDVPALHPAAEDSRDGFPAVVIPFPRPSRENGCRMSEAERRSRRNHPSNWRRRDEEAGVAEQRSRRNHPANWQPRDEAAEAAEQRSRWNHPSNWHRRREAEERRRWDEPGSR